MTVTTSHDLVVIECPNCAGTYAILNSYKSEAYRLGGFKKCWTCPYCKIERGYGEGADDRHAKALAQKDREIAAERLSKDLLRRPEMMPLRRLLISAPVATV